jgi:hypothetical protein
VTPRADHAVIESPNIREYVQLANYNDKTLTVPKAIVLGIAEMSESLINKINPGSKPDSKLPTKPLMQKIRPCTISYLWKTESFKP